MPKWIPKSRWEAATARSLPKSVVRLFDEPTDSIRVANTAVGVAKAVGGAVGALLTALYCYTVPVQVEGVSVDDVIFGIVENELGAGAPGAFVKRRRLGDRELAERQSFKGARLKLERRTRAAAKLGRSLLYGRALEKAEKDYGAHGSYKPDVLAWKVASRSQIEGSNVEFDSRGDVAVRKVYRGVIDRIRDGYNGSMTDVLQVRALLSNPDVTSGLGLGRMQADWRHVVGKLASIKDTVVMSGMLIELMVLNVIPDVWVAPLKGHPGARTKVNLFLADVLKDARKYFPTSYKALPAVFVNLLGANNDEVTGWVSWFVLAHTFMPRAAELMVSLRTMGSLVKDISTAVKSLGLNSTREGAMICEMVSLAGRGAVPGNADLDVSTRVSQKLFLRDKAAVMDKEKLREAVRLVIREELVREPKWQDKDDYWSKRWLYTKSGSHTRHIEDVMYGDRLDLPPQPTRREFAEGVEENIIAEGEPAVYAGLSWKLEQGKTRAIYGCDTRSYFTFDYLLGPVEKCWANKRTLLNPGLRAQADLYEDLASKGPSFYMLDFDDYNSQHELEAMKIVIEEACAGAPKEVLDWAVASWDNMWVRWVSDATGKLEKKRMVGTLPSGHRATTFINTILNTAYVRMVVGEAFDKVGSLHAGDDVVMWGDSEDISECINCVERSVLRVNRSKQSAGSVSGEFLRAAFCSSGARGYAARAISSAVSGNWVTEDKISPRSYVDNFTRLAWTVANRSGVRNAGALFVSSLRRRVPGLAHKAYDVCTNRVSVGGSPIWTDTPTQWTKLDVEGGTELREKVDLGLPSCATDAYLHNHVDIKLLKEAGVTPGSLRALMLKASYKPRGIKGSSELRFREVVCPPTVVQGLITVRYFPKRVVTQHSATKVLEGLISGVDWRVLVSRLRGTDSSYLSVTGKSEWPVGCDGNVTYSDCMALRNTLTRPTLVKTIFKVNV
ncbi:RNA dependent RNA polymerase [viral metagenome]